MSSMLFIIPIFDQKKLKYQETIHVSPYFLKWLSGVQSCIRQVVIQYLVMPVK